MSYPYIPLEIDLEIDDTCENVPLDIGEAFFAFENDYNKLENKPSINGEELVGDVQITDLFDIDAEPTEGSENAVSSGGVYDALQGKQDTLTIDAQPTPDSTNPVQSGGVAAALAGKQDALTIDTAPVEDSGNPISSGAVYTALEGKQDTLTIDATPTVGSVNPVQSGGVASALAAKQDSLTIDQAPTQGSDNPVASGGVFDALAGKQATLTFDDAPTNGSNNPVKSDGIYDALALKAPLASPDFTGNPTAPTQSSGDSSTKIATTAFVQGEIARTVSGVYRPAGSIAFAQLPALTAAHVGEVYDITDAFTTTADFVEGAGISYPAGTDVAIVEPTAGVYKYDAMSGMVDLSNYYTDAEVDTLLAGKQNSLPSTSAADNGKVLGVSGGVYALIAQSVAAPDVYWATYGTTTFAQLAAAIAAGQLPVCIYDELLFVCYGVTDEAISFVAQSAEAVNSVYVDNADSWEYETIYLQRSLTIDASPTLNSTNPVQSGGVYTALAGKQDALPTPSSADNGKFLRVVNGAYALATVPEAAGEVF